MDIPNEETLAAIKEVNELKKILIKRPMEILQNFWRI